MMDAQVKNFVKSRTWTIGKIDLNEEKKRLDDLDEMRAWGFFSSHCCLCNKNNSETGGFFLQCARCKVVHYCGMDCLKKDKDEHFKVCLGFKDWKSKVEEEMSSRPTLDLAPEPNLEPYEASAPPNEKTKTVECKPVSKNKKVLKQSKELKVTAPQTLSSASADNETKRVSDSDQVKQRSSNTTSPKNKEKVKSTKTSLEADIPALSAFQRKPRTKISKTMIAPKNTVGPVVSITSSRKRPTHKIGSLSLKKLEQSISPKSLDSHENVHFDESEEPLEKKLHDSLSERQHPILTDVQLNDESPNFSSSINNPSAVVAYNGGSSPNSPSENKVCEIKDFVDKQALGYDNVSAELNDQQIVKPENHAKSALPNEDNITKSPYQNMSIPVDTDTDVDGDVENYEGRQIGKLLIPNYVAEDMERPGRKVGKLDSFEMPDNSVQMTPRKVAKLSLPKAFDTSCPEGFDRKMVRKSQTKTDEKNSPRHKSKNNIPGISLKCPECPTEVLQQPQAFDLEETESSEQMTSWKADELAIPNTATFSKFTDENYQENETKETPQTNAQSSIIQTDDSPLLLSSSNGSLAANLDLSLLNRQPYICPIIQDFHGGKEHVMSDQEPGLNETDGKASRLQVQGFLVKPFEGDAVEPRTKGDKKHFEHQGDFLLDTGDITGSVARNVGKLDSFTSPNGLVQTMAKNSKPSLPNFPASLASDDPACNKLEKKRDECDEKKLLPHSNKLIVSDISSKSPECFVKPGPKYNVSKSEEIEPTDVTLLQTVNECAKLNENALLSTRLKIENTGVERDYDRQKSDKLSDLNGKPAAFERLKRDVGRLDPVKWPENNVQTVPNEVSKLVVPTAFDPLCPDVLERNKLAKMQGETNKEEYLRHTNKLIIPKFSSETPERPVRSVGVLKTAVLEETKSKSLARPKTRNKLVMPDAFKALESADKYTLRTAAVVPTESMDRELIRGNHLNTQDDLFSSQSLSYEDSAAIELDPSNREIVDSSNNDDRADEKEWQIKESLKLTPFVEHSQTIKRHMGQYKLIPKTCDIEQSTHEPCDESENNETLFLVGDLSLAANTNITGGTEWSTNSIASLEQCQPLRRQLGMHKLIAKTHCSEEQCQPLRRQLGMHELIAKPHCSESALNVDLSERSERMMSENGELNNSYCRQHPKVEILSAFVPSTSTFDSRLNQEARKQIQTQNKNVQHNKKKLVGTELFDVMMQERSLSKLKGANEDVKRVSKPVTATERNDSSLASALTPTEKISKKLTIPVVFTNSSIGSFSPSIKVENGIDELSRKRTKKISIPNLFLNQQDDSSSHYSRDFGGKLAMSTLDKSKVLVLNSEEFGHRHRPSLPEICVDPILEKIQGNAIETKHFAPLPQTVNSNPIPDKKELHNWELNDALEDEKKPITRQVGKWCLTKQN